MPVTKPSLAATLKRRTIAPLLIGIGLEFFVLLTRTLLALTALYDPWPPSSEFLRRTHLPSWYILLGIGSQWPRFFADYPSTALVLLFGMQTIVYAIIVRVLLQLAIKKTASSKTITAPD